jgi:hypothetical protein
MYGIKHLIAISFIVLFVGCSPAYRYHRLVTKYPFLLDSVSTDKIVIREDIIVDSVFIWESEVDTIFFPQATIERRHDTFRFYFRERPCTTYIQKTEVRPSKTIERYYQDKVNKTQAWEFFKLNFHWLLIILSLLLLLIRRK